MPNNPKAIDNLIPAKKGEIRNPKGRPKGIKNWSVIVQELLGDEALVDKVVSKKPTYWEYLPTKNGANAIVIAMMIKAMSGDKNAAEWLAKTGYKQEIDITTGGEQFRPITVEIIDVATKNTNTD